MSDNLKLLEAIPKILEIKRVQLSQEIIKERDPKQLINAKQNSRHVYAYRFVYRSNGLRIIGFIVEPRTGQNLPCVVFARGGSRKFGAIRLGSLFSGPMAAFAKAGYVVIASQHAGGSPDCEGDDDHGGKTLNDIAEFFTILREYPRADAKRIGMYGGSRGGMSVFLCLKKRLPIKAAVAVAPLTNLGLFRK